MTPLELQALFSQALQPIETLGRGRLGLAQLAEQRRRQDAMRSQELADARAQFDYETQAREAIATRTRESRRADAIKNGQVLRKMEDQFDALNSELTNAIQLTPEQEKQLAVAAARQAGLDEKWQAIIAKDPRKLFADANDAQDRVRLGDAREILQSLGQQQTATNSAQPKAQQIQRRLARVSRDMDLFTRTADIAFDPDMFTRGDQSAETTTGNDAPEPTVTDAIAQAVRDLASARVGGSQAERSDPTAGLPMSDDVRAAIDQRNQRQQEALRRQQMAAITSELKRRKEEMGVVDENFGHVAAALRGDDPAASLPVPASPYNGIFGWAGMRVPGVDPMVRAVALGKKKQQLQEQIKALSAQLGELEGPVVELPEFVVPNGGVPTAAPEVQRMTAEDMLRMRADAIRGISARDPWGAQYNMSAPAPWR